MPSPKSRKPSAKKGSRAKPAAKRAFGLLKLRVNVDEDTPAYYVNHLEVGHSLHEFALNASRTPTVLSKDRREAAQATGELVVSPELQLIFSPVCAKSLLHVLEVQVAAYETTFGPINTKGGRDE